MFTGQSLVNKEPPNLKVARTVGVISDTHVPKRARCIPKRVFEIFQGVDYIIHAGDLVELAMMDELEQIAPVLAVRGNSDGLDVAKALPKFDSLKFFDWKIGVIHDQNNLDRLDSMSEIAKANGFNVFVYGHTHIANILREGKILYVNPGSPTDPAGILNKPSVALLKITRETITPKIITI
ncbi:metallophosphoesterase [Candidatus Bathyarchaeota archaeon]|nr:MAG: metallophosphoesterase [Candidatus Bathyarchaeota archaeon]